MKLIFLYAIVGLLLISCLENQFDTNQLITENDITYLNPSQRKEEFPNDAFRIIGVTPLDQTWEVIVEYSGGCEEHQFFTYWEGLSNATANPNQVSFTLLHNSKGDLCERLVRDTLFLEIKDIFNADFTNDTLTISVVNGFTGKKIEVDPFLSKLSQGNSCELTANLVGTTCNDGFWQNQWFLLTDTVASYEKVWIQPVRAQDTRIPTAGRYKIGLRLLFGFEFSQKDCDELPDGKVIPATMTCIDFIN